MSAPSLSEQLHLLTRGIVDLCARSELEEKLKHSLASRIPLRIKAGFDPTHPDLHLGHTVVLTKLRQFQDLGHRVALVVGEFTATIGDPTGQSEARPRLTKEQVQEAAQTYTEQAFKILDPSRTELHSNQEWLEKLKLTEIVELMSHMTVARMLERNDFGNRFRQQRCIFQHEFLYPLLQGYDSVALNCDIEIGGTDQLFNLLAGRSLMVKYGQSPQIVMTIPLLEGIDARVNEKGEIEGKKMSKTAGNAISLTEEPSAMYRKMMQIEDAVIFRYFELLSTCSTETIEGLKREWQQERHPLEIKALFAQEIVTRFHSEEEAKKAKEEFEKIYQSDALPVEIEEYQLITTTPTLWTPKAIAQVGLTKSSSEAKRLIEQGGVEVDQMRVTDSNHQLEAGRRYLVRIGSKHRRFAYIHLINAHAP
ncbi:tyrosine--tRNA ligase [Pajaroellobacter abortibovis]|uniref:Tyrosine--tRNA ligase n=1 Tax=Pajaroellobacter abortibovis TaxID=1882918 RepID=A0A1L6MVY4_9BACT|nr:tyrosine--tRNA ligase [Pajaroellobacter abortibovis]APR99710.1 tyrosine--tRNA ligase [Pajaroellobacter abortibovis]